MVFKRLIELFALTYFRGVNYSKIDSRASATIIQKSTRVDNLTFEHNASAEDVRANYFVSKRKCVLHNVDFDQNRLAHQRECRLTRHSRGRNNGRICDRVTAKVNPLCFLYLIDTVRLCSFDVTFSCSPLNFKHE